MISALIFIVVSYLCGSIPTGFWLIKAVKGVDIRDYGSKSTGATNVWRCFGKPLGLTVFFIDFLKGYLPTALAHYASLSIFQSDWTFASGLTPALVPAFVALAALVGHSRSVFLKGGGGKSAATGLGTLTGLNPLTGLLTFLTWYVMVKLTRYVSLSSIIGVFCCGFYFWLNRCPWPYVVYGGVGFVWVTLRHKANIKRLLKGEEPKAGDKPKDLHL